jgi:hypothetical protein
MLFGQRFVWVKDCHAAKFVLSYKGTNLVFLRLQMRLMCWEVDIVHHPDSESLNTDYWSRLGANMEYNSLLCNYLEFTMGMVHASVDQKVTPINLIVRQNQPLKVKKMKKMF